MNQKRNPKGMGSFRENADGTITHRKTVGIKANGYRKILTVTGQTKSECLKKMKKKEEAWKHSQENPKAGFTVKEMCEAHLKSQVEGCELKPKSVNRRQDTINLIGRNMIGSMEVTTVTPPDVETFINGLINRNELSASSIKKTIDVMNAAYNWCVRRLVLSYNPVLAVKRELTKKVSKLEQREEATADVVVLSEKEKKDFINECNKKRKNNSYVYGMSGLYLQALLFTGMRVGELISLRWKDLDMGNRLVYINKSTSTVRNEEGRYVQAEDITKNAKSRVIKISEEAWSIFNEIKTLTSWKEPEDYVTPTRTGKQNTASNLGARCQVIYQAIERPEYKGKLHILRRTKATELYRAGARTKEVAAYLGDVESTVSQYYIAARVKVDVDGKAVNIVEHPA